MLSKEMSDLCQAVTNREAKLVQHKGLLYVGEVKACHGDRLEVESFGHVFEWDAERCRPIDDRVARLGPPSKE